jgi:hypothetical protein
MGISFALAGLVQLFMADVVVLVQGTCHLKGVGSQCTHGHWRLLHAVEAFVLALLFICPWAEYVESKRRDERARLSLGCKSYTYGSVDITEENDGTYESGSSSNSVRSRSSIVETHEAVIA